MVGAQKGALQSDFFIFSLFFIVLHDDLSPAFAPLDANQSRLRAAFFVSEIQSLLVFPRSFSLSASVNINLLMGIYLRVYRG